MLSDCGHPNTVMCFMKDFIHAYRKTIGYLYMRQGDPTTSSDTEQEKAMIVIKNLIL